jgi:hypothetical protein
MSEHVHFGDSRAAVVMSVKPVLLIAAFTDELDCVAVLGYVDKGPREYPRNLARRLVRTYDLEEGKRLLTVNTYIRAEGGVAADLTAGPRAFRRWTDFMPIIADFVTEDNGRVVQRKAAITAEDGSEQRRWAMQRCSARDFERAMGGPDVVEQICDDACRRIMTTSRCGFTSESNSKGLSKEP